MNSSALATEFDISEDAIRRDLRALAADGLCRRVYGGALPLAPGMVPIANRTGVDVARKRALARAAVSLVVPGSFLFLDNGSTSLVIADELPRDADLIVATSSIEIAATLASRRDVQIHMIGGEVNAVIGGSVDAIALDAIARLNIDTCFLGVCALSADGGVSAFDAADAAFKRALVASSRDTLVLALNEKIGARAPHRITTIDAVAQLVVEHDADDAAVDALRRAGADVRRAGASAA